VGSDLDLVRAIYADWRRGDFSRVDWADPDLELVWRGASGDQVGRGLAEAAQLWAEWLSGWEDFAVEPEEFVELDSGVLVLVHFHGRGKHSGLEADDLRGANRFEIRAGKVVCLVLYEARALALEDAGLAR
jgi:hypothetical protein